MALKRIMIQMLFHFDKKKKKKDGELLKLCLGSTIWKATAYCNLEIQIRRKERHYSGTQLLSPVTKKKKKKSF